MSKWVEFKLSPNEFISFLDSDIEHVNLICQTDEITRYSTVTLKLRSGDFYTRTYKNSENAKSDYYDFMKQLKSPPDLFAN